MVDKCRIFLVFLLIMGIILGLNACTTDNAKPEKVSDVDFTVVEDNAVPEELQKLIEEKKQTEFCLTYTEGDALYLAIGYGEKETAGYSISVADLYLTADSLYVNTELMGPEKGEQAQAEVTYPWIVVKTEKCDCMVYFD